MVSSLSNHVVHVQSCSNSAARPWWTHTSSARPHALAHENCEHCRYGTAGPHRDKSRLTTHPKQLNIYILRHVFNISYHADTRSTWSFMKADINIQRQRSERQNSPSSGCQSQALLQVATLGIHTSLLSWTAAAGTSENAHKHGPAFDLSLINQCAKIASNEEEANWLLPRSKRCLSFRKHIESTYPSGIIRPPALPESL